MFFIAAKLHIFLETNMVKYILLFFGVQEINSHGKDRTHAFDFYLIVHVLLIVCLIPLGDSIM